MARPVATGVRAGGADASRHRRLRFSRAVGARARTKGLRLEVVATPLEQFLIGIAHGFGLAASDHDLKIDRLQAVVLIAVDNSRGAGDAFPGAEAAGDPAGVFIFDEDVEMALAHEEDFFD